MKMDNTKWIPPSGLDIACLNLLVAMNALPGIKTRESCCGHGNSEYRIWFKMDDARSLGAITFSRCLSGRYYNYAPGELRLDPQWRVYLADTEGPVGFLLEGKPMIDDTRGGRLHKPAEKLATNLQEHIAEDFKMARYALSQMNMDEPPPGYR